MPLCLTFFLSVCQKGLLCPHPFCLTCVLLGVRQFCPTCVLPGAKQRRWEILFSTGSIPGGRWSGNCVHLFSVTSFQSAVLGRFSYFLEKCKLDQMCSSVSLQSGLAGSIAWGGAWRTLALILHPPACAILVKAQRGLPFGVSSVGNCFSLCGVPRYNQYVGLVPPPSSWERDQDHPDTSLAQRK